MDLSAILVQEIDSDIPQPVLIEPQTGRLIGAERATRDYRDFVTLGDQLINCRGSTGSLLIRQQHLGIVALYHKALELIIIKIEGFIQIEVSYLLVRNVLTAHLDSKPRETSRGLTKAVIIINVNLHHDHLYSKGEAVMRGLPSFS